MKSTAREGVHFSMMCYAVADSNMKTLKYCLSRGATADEVNAEGQTTMHLAAYVNNVPAVQLLCRHGAHSRLKDSYGFTSVMVAAEHGFDRVLATLLRSGHSLAAEHHRTREGGATPIMLACLARGGQPGHLRVLRLLIAAGESVLDTTDQHRTALHMAASFNHVEAAALLLREGSPVDARTVQGDTPLHCAAQEGNTDLAVLLVEHGADPNSLNQDGETALHLATRPGSEDCLAAMIRAGANIETRDRRGRALIDHLAGLPVAAVRAVAHTVDLCRTKDHLGNGLLHLAVREDNYALAHSLCNTETVDPNCTNSAGDTPLHEAVRDANPRMVDLLLRYCASPYIANAKGVSATQLSKASSAGAVWSAALASIAPNTTGGCEENPLALSFGAKDGSARVEALLDEHSVHVDRMRDSIGLWLDVS